MPNTINATTGGIVSTGDSTATLDIQTGGVTAISVGSGQSVTISNLADANGSLRNIPSAGAAKTSAYTLSISDNGEFVTLGTGGAIVVPNDIFTAGNAVSIFNNTTGNATISLTITTAYIAGTDSDKASVSLATRGITTILFINPSLCVLSGNVS